MQLQFWRSLALTRSRAAGPGNAKIPYGCNQAACTGRVARRGRAGRSYAGHIRPPREACSRRSKRGVSLTRWAMNDAGNVLLSVRAEARQLVAPDYAVLDGLLEHTAGSSAPTWPAPPRQPRLPSLVPRSRCCMTGGCANAITGSATGCPWPNTSPPDGPWTTSSAASRWKISLSRTSPGREDGSTGSASQSGP